MSWKKSYLSKSSFSQVNLQMCKKIGIKESFWLCEMISRDDWLDDLNRNDPEWFYFQQEKFKDRTGMSIRIQNKISESLKEIEVIDKELKGNPAKNWYRINYDKVDELTSLETQYLQNVVSTKPRNLVSTKPRNSIISNKDNNKEPSTFSFSGNWKKTEYKDKFDFIHSRHPKIDPTYLRYAINWQDRKLEKFTSFFKSYSDIKLINQIIDSCKTIDELIRIDKHYFRETIVPALKWASKDNFWHDKILSLTNLRKKNKEGEMKFTNILKQWCREEDIDPRKGRYVLSSEVIITPAVNPKWTEYLNAKRKEQGIGMDDLPEGLSQDGFEEFFKEKGIVTI